MLLMASSKGLPARVLWSRLLLIALVNLILIEVLVRAVNFIIPLERPARLADSYTNE